MHHDFGVGILRARLEHLIALAQQSPPVVYLSGMLWFAIGLAIVRTHNVWRRDWTALDPDRRARRVADYIAGMTDRYALDEHRRLFDATPDLR